jgi:hypothetical protein
MKRIISLILASIIVSNLSACGKTKRLIQPGIQQTSSDTIDYKKLYENECRVSKRRNHINWVLGLVASVAVLVSLHFADKAVYSKIMANAAKKSEIAYDTYYLPATPDHFSYDDNNVLSKYEIAFKANYDFGCIVNSSDKDLALSTFGTLKRISSTDDKLNQIQKGLAAAYANKYKIVETQSILPYRSLRTVGWNWIESKFVGRKKNEKADRNSLCVE